MQHPFDLANLVTGDHRLAETLFGRIERNEGLRQTLFDQVILNVAVHAGGEEQVFYPALGDTGGDATVKENLLEHQPVKEALAVLDRHEAGTVEAEAAMRTVIDSVRAHLVGEEHDQLPWLRSQLGDDQMLALGRSFQEHERRAPTHAHPHAPSNPVLAGPAALIDKLRDKANHRDHETATDGSGLLDPQAQELIDTLASLGVKPLHLLEPAAARNQPTLADAVQTLLAERGQTGPEHVGSVEDCSVPGPGRDIPVRIYRPAGSKDATVLPVVVYVHGGGWVIFDLDVYDASCRGLTNKTGAMVISIEYRHAPEAPFPAAHVDVLAATRWIMGNTTRLGGDPTNVAIVGESAGGNMAAATCIALAQAGEPVPVFQVLLYPVTSTAMDTASYAEAADARPLYSGLMNWFFGHTITRPADLENWRLNLLSASTEQLAGLPPTLIITAERDPLRDEGEAFAELLKTAGVTVQTARYAGMMHEFFGAAAVLGKAAQAQEQAACVLREAFQTPPTNRLRTS